MTINTPNGWNDDLKSIMEWLSDEKRDELLEMLKQDKKERGVAMRESLHWDKEAILKDLKENHVKIEEDAESPFNCFLGRKWRIFHIDLPAVWNFKWFKFDFYVSDWYVKKEDFDQYFEKTSLLYSYWEMWEHNGLLRAIAEYMKESWVKLDEWEQGVCLKNITGLNNRYRCKEKCQFGFDKQTMNRYGNRGKLLFKLSD